MSVARKRFDWAKMFELSVDPERAREFRNRRKSRSPDVCSMCGEFCAMKMADNAL
jgi:phosphomethylpyrimidine synthase